MNIFIVLLYNKSMICRAGSNFLQWKWYFSNNNYNFLLNKNVTFSVQQDLFIGEQKKNILIFI